MDIIDGRWSSNSDYTATNQGLASITTTGSRKLGDGVFYFEIITPSSGTLTNRGLGFTENDKQAWVSNGYMPKTMRFSSTLMGGAKYGVILNLTSPTMGKARYKIDDGDFSDWINLVDYSGAVLTSFRPMILGSSSSNTSLSFTINTGQSSMPYLKNKFDYKLYSFDGSLQSHVNKILISSGDKFYSFIPAQYGNFVATPKMTGDSSPSGRVFYSSAYNASAQGWYAFDQIDNGQGFISAGVFGFLGYEFGGEETIWKYGVRSGDTSNVGIRNAMPKDWTFEGSNDGVNWVVLDTRYNESWATADRYVSKEYMISKEFRKKFKFFRLNYSSNNGYNTYTNINELQLFAQTVDKRLMIIDKTIGEKVINYGQESLDNISEPCDLLINIGDKSNVLGSGKTFEHTINMSKRRVDKITLG